MVHIAMNSRIKGRAVYQGVLSIRQEGHGRYPQRPADGA